MENRKRYKLVSKSQEAMEKASKGKRKRKAESSACKGDPYDDSRLGKLVSFSVVL